MALPHVRSQNQMLAVMNADRIGKLIKMLSSPNDGEVVAAARAILRTLQAEGTDIHELAARIEGRKLSEAEMQIVYDKAFQDGKSAATAATGSASGFSPVEVPTFYSMACEIQAKANDRLSPKEQDFIEDMVRWCAHREPSEKQAKWLHSIYYKIGRRQ
jgi:hypothetical protein